MKNKFFFYSLAFLISFFSILQCNSEKGKDESTALLLSAMQRVNENLLPGYMNTPRVESTSITLTVAVESSSRIQLMWTALPSAVNYKVYRSLTASFTPSTNNEVVSTATSVTLISPRGNLITPLNSSTTAAKNSAGLTSGTRYYYKVAGVTASGTEIYSNEVSAIPASGLTVRTHAGGSGGAGNTNGDGYDAKFNFPQGLSVDANGFIYLADSANHLIRRISPRIGDVVNSGGSAYAIEGQATTFAGLGTWGNANSPLPLNASFFDPWATCVDSTTGNIYVADSTNHSIRQITPSGVVTTLAGANTAASGSGSTNAVGTSARFYYPQAIACDGTNVFVADTYNNSIRQVVIATSTVTTLAGSAGQAGQGSTDGTGTAARFYLPRGIVVDNTGTNLYVSDSGNHTIRRIVIATGVVTTLAGSAGVQGKTDGVGTAASFAFPRGVAFSSVSGNLYVADSSNHLIRRVNTTTGDVATVAGTGTQGGQDGVGIYASFWFPQGITYTATTAGGCPCLYVSDTENHKIRRITGTL